MTQAYNLAILANAVDTSGKLNVGTNATGTLPVANGGSGAATLPANNVLLGNGTSALQGVAPGASGNVLTSNGTTWTSAAASAYTGVRAQSFTSSGTFTVPAGITAVKVSATGGGGGGGGTSNGGAGGSSSFGSFVVGGGGAGGGRGFDNGIECVTATGPAGGSSTNIPYNYSNFSLTGTRGNGGSGGSGSPSQCGGGGGATASQGVGYVTGLTPGANITVTIGSGGTAGGGGSTVGQPGAIAIEW